MHHTACCRDAKPDNAIPQAPSSVALLPEVALLLLCHDPPALTPVLWLELRDPGGHDNAALRPGRPGPAPARASPALDKQGRVEHLHVVALWAKKATPIEPFALDTRRKLNVDVIG